MELAGNKPRMILDLDHLNQTAVRTGATDDKAMFFQQRSIFEIELVAVSMPFHRLVSSIGPLGECAGDELGGPTAEAHRGSLVSHLFLLLEQTDHRVTCFFVELRAVRF